MKTSVLPAEFEPHIREVLGTFGLKPELWHDQTHKKIRRIGLRIPSEQLAQTAQPTTAPAVTARMSTLEMLEHVTGVKWQKNPETHGYVSATLYEQDAADIKRMYFPAVRSGGQAIVMQSQDDHTAYLELSPRYAIQWKGAQFADGHVKVLKLNDLLKEMTTKASFQARGGS